MCSAQSIEGYGISRSKTDGRRRLKESLVGNGWVRPTRSSTLLVFLLVEEDVCRHDRTGPRCWVPIIIRSKNISGHSIKSAATTVETQAPTVLCTLNKLLRYLYYRMMKVVVEKRIPTRAVLRTWAILLLLLLSSSIPCFQAWTLPRHTTHRLSSSTRTRTATTTTSTQRATSSLQNPTSTNKDEQIDELKAEIARMRQEALARLELLNQEMHSAETAWNEHKTLNEPFLAAAVTGQPPLSAGALSTSTTTSTSTPVTKLAPEAKETTTKVTRLIDCTRHERNGNLCTFWNP